MPDIHARRLLAATLSRCRRAWLCGLLILSTPPVPLPADARSTAEGDRD